jgi:hypothetical protein
MSQQAPTCLSRISQRLGEILRYQENPILASGLGRLILLLSTSVCLTFWLTTHSVDANMLFQSPQSPPAQPSIQQPPVQQPPIEQPPVAEPPLEQPPVEQAPVEQPPAEAPVESAPVPESPETQAPVEQPPVEQPPAETAPPAEQAVSEPTLPEQSEPEPVSRRRREAPVEEAETEGPSNFILDQAELIDSVIVSGAWIWLCCGFVLLLLAPLFFLFVYIRGRSKIIDEGF